MSDDFSSTGPSQSEQPGNPERKGWPEWLKYLLGCLGVVVAILAALLLWLSCSIGPTCF